MRRSSGKRTFTSTPGAICTRGRQYTRKNGTAAGRRRGGEGEGRNAHAAACDERAGPVRPARLRRVRPFHSSHVCACVALAGWVRASEGNLDVRQPPLTPARCRRGREGKSLKTGNASFEPSGRRENFAEGGINCIFLFYGRPNRQGGVVIISAPQPPKGLARQRTSRKSEKKKGECNVGAGREKAESRPCLSTLTAKMAIDSIVRSRRRRSLGSRKDDLVRRSSGRPEPTRMTTDVRRSQELSVERRSATEVLFRGRRRSSSADREEAQSLCDGRADDNRRRCCGDGKRRRRSVSHRRSARPQGAEAEEPSVLATAPEAEEAAAA